MASHLTDDEIIKRDTEGKERDSFTLADLRYFMREARKDELAKMADNRKIEDIMLKVPVWYRKQHMKSYLLNANYSEQIAEELSANWAENLQQSFRKGFEKGVQFISGRWVNGIITDDTEQQQQPGTKVWISMDETGSNTGGSSDADIWFGGDKPYLEGGIHYSQTSEHRIGVPRFVAQMFGLQPGQCKPFLITEVQDVSI